MGESFFAYSALVGLLNGTFFLFLNPRRAINQVFFGASVWIALWFLCIVLAIQHGQNYNHGSAEDLIFWLRVSATVAAYLGWFLWLMQSAVLEENKSVLFTIKRSWPWFIICSCVACLAFSEKFISPESTPQQKDRGYVYVAYILIQLALGIWLLVGGWRNSKKLNGIRKIEMQLLVSAWTSTCLIFVITTAVGIFFDVHWLRRSGPIWFTALHGVTAWVVCYHRIFDAKQMFVSLGQKLMFPAFVGVCALLGTEILGADKTSRLVIFFAAVFYSSISIWGNRFLGRLLGLDLERILKSPRQKIIDLARQYSDEETLKLRFEEFLQDWCQTSNVRLLTSFTDFGIHQSPIPELETVELVHLCRDGWTTPESLLRRKETPDSKACRQIMLSRNIGAILATPIGSPNPILVVVLDQKQSLRPYTFPDIQILLNLVELMGNFLISTRSKAKSAHIEKLESAAMMSRGLAHDLNNLATPVSTFLMHMESRVQAGSAEAEVLSDAKHSIKVMQDYIRDSLFFSRRLVPNYQTISTHDLFDSILLLTQERARKRGVRVQVSGSTDLHLRADRALMQRLLQNLVLNGIDASPRGGQVTLSSQPAGKTRVTIRVADQGPGIPPGLRDRIFEPYFTTKDTGDEVRGLGLGLAISQKIGGLHGGDIQVENAASGGAIFTVTLPVPAEPPAEAQATAKAPQPLMPAALPSPDTSIAR